MRQPAFCVRALLDGEPTGCKMRLCDLVSAFVRYETMTQRNKYPFVESTRKLCAISKISPERVLRRAGLPADALSHEGSGISAAQTFEIWNAAVAEAKRPDLPLFLGRTLARGSFNAAVLAFSCSPNVEIGLTRLALFKPLIAPIVLKVERKAETLEVSLESADPDRPLPDGLAVFEAVFFLELARILTSEHIVPVSVELPGSLDQQEGFRDHFGVPIDQAPIASLILTLEDAERPLITENAEFWEDLEKNLRRQLLDFDRDALMSTRVKNALLEMLPGGQSSAGAVCKRLNVTRRSLQRHLKNEGKTFQSVLDATRSELSLKYLAREDFSVEEISYLLAFRDPNSFYRAFRGWTGMTPMEARGQSTH